MSLANDINIKDDISWELSKRVKETCAHFFKTAELSYFDYARFYPDDTFFILYSDGGWVDCFLNRLKYGDAGPPIILPPGAHLWKSYIEESTVQLANIEFGHDNGLTLKTPYKDYVEVANFAAIPGNNKIFELYLNKKSIFYKFKEYFKKVNKSIISLLEQRKWVLTAQHAPKAKQELFINETDLKKAFPPDFLGSDILYDLPRQECLSIRERECLFQLINGMSSKEIGRILNISPRTTEKHLESIKNKYNCRTRIELLCKIISLFLS